MLHPLLLPPLLSWRRKEERPKRGFSRFCTLQKSQKEVFYASAHCRKAKKKFFTLLHTAERPKRRFSRFCTLQKGQKLIFHASARCRKTKKSFSRFCTLQKGQKGVFHASAHCRKTKKKYYKKESIKIQLSLT